MSPGVPFHGSFWWWKRPFVLFFTPNDPFTILHISRQLFSVGAFATLWRVFVVVLFSNMGIFARLRLWAHNPFVVWTPGTWSSVKIKKIFIGPMYMLLLSFTVISNVSRPFITTKTTLYCLTQWQLFTRPSQFSQVSGIVNCSNL